MSIRTFSRAALVLAFTASFAPAAEDASSPAAEPMLTGNLLTRLPSKPGAHIQKIKAMKGNQWLNVGSPAADPKWGRARGRSWGGSAMVPAPDLRGAMFTGEGRHAFVKPHGYGMDDWWFYDINAHAWICLWPGTNTKDFNRQVKEGRTSVDGLGRAVDASGQPVPGHLLIHTYHFLIYDPDLKKFVLGYHWPCFGKYYMPGGAGVNEGIDSLIAQGLNTKEHLFGHWAYDTRTGRFERYTIKSPPPVVRRQEFPFFEYISSRKKYLAMSESSVTYFDPSTRTWSKGSPSHLVGYDFSGCYDSKRDRVYCGGGGDSFFCFDLKDESWTKIRFPASDTSLDRRDSLSTNAATVVYDSGNDRVLVMCWHRDANRAYPIDPATNEVLTPVPFDPAFVVQQNRKCTVAFYDRELGVIFIFFASDSWDDGQMWAFKYEA